MASGAAPVSGPSSRCGGGRRAPLRAAASAQRLTRVRARAQVLDTVAEIQERHSAVKDLERQLLGLHQIFLDMAVLVEAQGEMLDNIETQVSKANEFVNQGNKALTSAKALQKDTRKYMCCALMMLLSICVIVVIAVIKPWKNQLWCVHMSTPAASLTPTARRARALPTHAIQTLILCALLRAPPRSFAYLLGIC